MNVMISSTLLQMLIILVKNDFECCKISYSEMLFLKALKILFPNSLILLLSHDECLWHLCLGYYGASGDRLILTPETIEKKVNIRKGLEDPGQWTTKGSEHWEAGNTRGEPSTTPAHCPGRLHRPQHREGRSSRSSRGGDGSGSLGRPSSQGRVLDKREPHRRRTPQTCRGPPVISTSLWGTYTRLRKEPPKSIRGNDTQAHTTTPVLAHKSGKLHNSWGIQESTQKDLVSPTEAEKRDPKGSNYFRGT